MYCRHAPADWACRHMYCRHASADWACRDMYRRHASTDWACGYMYYRHASTDCVCRHMYCRHASTEWECRHMYCRPASTGFMFTDSHIHGLADYYTKCTLHIYHIHRHTILCLQQKSTDLLRRADRLTCRPTDHSADAKPQASFTAGNTWLEWSFNADNAWLVCKDLQGDGHGQS